MSYEFGDPVNIGSVTSSTMGIPVIFLRQQDMTHESSRDGPEKRQ